MEITRNQAANMHRRLRFEPVASGVTSFTPLRCDFGEKAGGPRLIGNVMCWNLEWSSDANNN